MFTRSKRYGTVEIKATFVWDAGDPSTGISAHWGEGTLVEITTPLEWMYEPAPKLVSKLITLITFSVQEDKDPGEWAVEEVETLYRADTPVTLASSTRWPDTPAVVTLAALPEVAEVVREAWEDVRAAEWLTEAQSAVDELEAYADELASAASQGDASARMELVGVRESLNAARVELTEAQERVRVRGI